MIGEKDMAKKIKLGVVGCARGGWLISLAGTLDGVEVRAICDREKDRLEEGKKQLADKNVNTENMLCFDNYSEMLKSDIDAVIIANHGNEHVPLVVEALEAGKHVLSEIPAIYTVEEAKILKDAVMAHPELKYMFAENCCYWAHILAWKKMREEGKFGEIVYAESEYLHAVNPDSFKPYEIDAWRAYQPAIRYITHNLGPILYIMGDKITSVSCMAPSVKYNPYKKAAETGVAIFKTEKGAVIRILICFGAYVGFDHNFRVLGTRGTAETDCTKTFDEAKSFVRLSEYPVSFERKIELPIGVAHPGESLEGHGGADLKMVKDFVDCVVNDTKPPLDVEFAISVSIAGILAEQSANRGGEVIEIPPFEKI